MTLNIMTFSMWTQSKTVKRGHTNRNIRLSVTVLSVVMLSGVMLSVIMLGVIMLSVVLLCSHATCHGVNLMKHLIYETFLV
jgi:hypothetical protein